MKYVYAALHNQCTHESEFSTISLHETRAGAEAAVEKAKAKEVRRYKYCGMDLPDWNQFKVERMKVSP